MTSARPPVSDEHGTGTPSPSAHRSTKPLQRVGNDVVDLGHPRCGERGESDRLLLRILSDPEREWLDAPDPPGARPRRLWALWAAKETAFKVHCKLLRARPTFTHRAYECRLTMEQLQDEGPARIRGMVRGPEDAPPVRVEGSASPNSLHLVGWNGSADELRRGRLEIGLEEVSPPGWTLRAADLRSHFSDDEWAGVHSLASARIRILARERILAHLGRKDETEGDAPRVEILTSGERPGRTPPWVRVDGEKRPDLDLSLSHHGRFMAWALLLPGAFR